MSLKTTIALGVLIALASASSPPGYAAESNPLQLTPHHATISVADLDKESAWYERVLGMEKSNPYSNADSSGCWMIVPGYRIDLIQQKGSSRGDTRIGLMRQGWLHVSLKSLVMEEALKRLQAAGTDVQAYRDDKSAIIRMLVHDPEGNEVEVHR